MTFPITMAARDEVPKGRGQVNSGRVGSTRSHVATHQKGTIEEISTNLDASMILSTLKCDASCTVEHFENANQPLSPTKSDHSPSPNMLCPLLTKIQTLFSLTKKDQHPIHNFGFIPIHTIDLGHTKKNLMIPDSLDSIHTRPYT